MRARKQQQGLAGAALVVLVILGLVALLFGRGYFHDAVSLDQRAATDAAMRRVSDALVAFATLNRRLPCPAQGNAGDGVELPAAPSTSCNYDDGVVPWVTLGLKQSDATDAWGGKLSYRVYAQGNADAFTRANGVNATDCSTETAVGGPTAVAVNCSATHDTHFVNFLRSAADPANHRRGLAVNDRGTVRDGLAFVLVSHGPTLQGGFGAESNVRAAAPASAAELRNTQAPSSPPWNSPFVITAASDPSVAPSDAAHYDDIVASLGAEELVTRAKLASRAWPSPALVTDRALVTALLPSYNPDATQNTGVSTLAVGPITISAYANSVAQNIGFRERSGTGGIGVISPFSSTSGSISSFNNEVLVIEAGAGSTFQKLDVGLNEFQTRTTAPFASERVELSLWRTPEGVPSPTPVLVQATTLDSWHAAAHPSLCLLASIPGTIFDRLEIRPLVRSDGQNSSLTLAGLKACSVAVDNCELSLADTDSVRCPARPPGASTSAAMVTGVDSATFSGYADDHGTDTTVSFEYGASTAYGTAVAATPATVANGDGYRPVTASVTGLACGTLYHYRTKTVNAGGTTVGNDVTFTTVACP